MALFDKVQQLVDATPAPASWGIMIGSLIVSVLQPVAIVVTILWGALQIHGAVEKKFGRDFLWLNSIFRKKVK